MVVESHPMPPDEEAFRAHVSAGRFSVGVIEGDWRVVDITWPQALIAISAASRAGAPGEYFFLFDLAGYPNVAATAQVWNPEQNRLACESERPKVTYAPSPFRSDWNSGTALYIPCDRIAFAGHPWAQTHPGDLWDPAKGISKYVRYVHRRLNESAYVGL